LSLLRVMSEAVLRRSAGFSRALLADAMATLSGGSVALLLRVFLHMLRGLSDLCRGDAHLGPFGDGEVCRAVDWVEALLDSQFVDLALTLRGGEAGITPVAEALRKVGAVDAASSETESLLGLCEHVFRSSATGGIHSTSHAFEVYSVDKLCF
jgi:hypothetical protein